MKTKYKIVIIILVMIGLSFATNNEVTVQKTVEEMLKNSKSILMIGGLVAGVYGGWQVMVKTDGTIINWILFIGGVGLFGATDQVSLMISSLFKGI